MLRLSISNTFKILIVSISLIMFGCAVPVEIEKHDDISELIKAHRSGNLKSFLNKFGQPMAIKTTEDRDQLLYTYPHFETLVNPSKNAVIATSTFFWRSDDDYAYLKKLFGQYEWIEKPLPSPSHEISEIYSVEIPAIGVSFEYDRYAPKITWIFISKPVTK